MRETGVVDGNRAMSVAQDRTRRRWTSTEGFDPAPGRGSKRVEVPQSTSDVDRSKD